MAASLIFTPKTSLTRNICNGTISHINSHNYFCHSWKFGAFNKKWTIRPQICSYPVNFRLFYMFICPQLVPIGTRTFRHVDKGCVCNRSVIDPDLEPRRVVVNWSKVSLCLAPRVWSKRWYDAGWITIVAFLASYCKFLLKILLKQFFNVFAHQKVIYNL